MDAGATRETRGHLAPGGQHADLEGAVTWAEFTIIRILLLIARMLTKDPSLRDELQALANVIAAGQPSAQRFGLAP